MHAKTLTLVHFCYIMQYKFERTLGYVPIMLVARFKEPLAVSLCMSDCVSLKTCNLEPELIACSVPCFRVGIEDDLGADQMMLSALDKVEKNIGKRLTKDDANGMSLWKKEIDQIDQK